MKTHGDKSPVTAEQDVSSIDRRTTEMIATAGRAELELPETVEDRDTTES